jgi:hypothetical protein
MAKLIGGVEFTGSLQNLSAYKMRGSDKIIIRIKGGPTKKQIQRSPRFELTRRNNMEFGGRSKAAAQIKAILWPLLFIADYNITGPLNALLKPIQQLDTQNELGKRNVLVSKNPRLLEGFALNRRYLLESIVRTPFVWSVEKDQVIVDLPSLLPGINFVVPVNYAWYRITALAAHIPDLFYTEHGYKFKDDQNYFWQHEDTEWLPVNTPAPARKLTIQKLPEHKPENSSLMVAVSIAFGTMQNGVIERVKYIGAGKIIGME